MNNENSNLLRGINKLESIGKKGKLSKIIKLTIEHFDYLKQSLNELSIKILAYIIKGFFLAIKKSYENFNRELEAFIEFNIKGIKRKNKKEVKKDETNSILGEVFTIQNLSLFSENTKFEKFLNDTNMSDKINKTLKRINKKFISVDFSSMTENKKKDYLKKNFIQPLTESLSMKYDFFQNSNIEQCISVNQDFANYIQFDIKTIAGDLFGKINPLSNNFEENLEQPFLPPQSIDEIILNKNIEVKNPYLKCDSKIEINVHKFISKNERACKGVNTHSMIIYQKNFKSLLLTNNLLNFKNSLMIGQKEKFLFIKHRDILINDRYEHEVCSYQSQTELFRNDSQKGNKQKSSQIMCSPNSQIEARKLSQDIASIMSIKNIFDNGLELELYPSQKSNKAAHSQLLSNINSDDPKKQQEIYLYNNSQQSQSVEFKRLSQKQNEIENMILINSEIQNLITRYYLAYLLF